MKALTVDSRLRPNGLELQRLVNSMSVESPTRNVHGNNYEPYSPLQRPPSLNRTNSNQEVGWTGSRNQQQQQQLAQSQKLYGFVPQQQIILNQQPQQQVKIQPQPQQYSDKISNTSVKSYGSQSQNSPTMLRQTMPNQPNHPNFLNLRKRIQTNNFGLNVTPVRMNENYEQQSPYLAKYEPMTPTIEYKRYQN